MSPGKRTTAERAAQLVTLAVCLAISLGIAPCASAQQTLYVRHDASGAENGTSWVDAYTFLQDALDTSNAGDEIWVAAGVYHPDQGGASTPGDRTLSFELKSGVRLHGGFDGTESARLARDLATHQTILSGDLTGDDDGLVLRDDNSYHVVRATNVDDSALLDGFVIVGGNADGGGADSLGGGILVAGGAPWIVNTRVNSSTAECGGGIAVIDGGAPRMVNTVVNGNRGGLGGGICNLNSDPEIMNTTVTGNTAALAPGVYNNASDPTIINTIVSGNRFFANVDHCERWQYPCSVSDVSEEVLEESAAVMEGAANAGAIGTMADALAFVESHPSVVQSMGNSQMVVARVGGGPMASVLDARGLLPGGGQSGKRDPSVEERTTHGDFRPSERRANNRGGANKSGKQLGVSGERTIVGEDWNSDGKIDNRDGKRALIISPFDFEDAVFTRDQLAKAAYNVSYFGKFEHTQDPFLALSTWRAWEEVDLVYLATLAVSVCSTTDPSDCHTNVTTGIPSQTPASQEVIQVVLEQWFINDNGVDQTLALTPRSFRQFYNGGLDNAVVFCSYCDIKNDEWTSTLGVQGNNFAALGWAPDSNRVPRQVVDSNIRMISDLNTGNTIEYAHDKLVELHLIDVSTPQGYALFAVRPLSTFEPYFVRIIELPTLLFQPDRSPGPVSAVGLGQLVDGTDITSMIRGTVGDNENDELDAWLIVRGVTDKDQFSTSIRFLINGVPIDGFWGLTGRDPLPGSETDYFIVPAIELGFPVQKGPLTIEVIVDVPEGGDSRYAVKASVDAFACSATTSFSGFRNGAFTGPANGDFNDSGGGLLLESVGSPFVNEGPLGPDSYRVNLLLTDPETYYNDAGTKIDSTVYKAIASLGHNQAYDNWFFSSAEDTTACDGCGRDWVRLDSASTDSTTFYGEFEFTGGDVDIGPTGETRVSTAKGSFRAVTGSMTSPNSAYFKCLQGYRDFLEQE